MFFTTNKLFYAFKSSTDRWPTNFYSYWVVESRIRSSIGIWTSSGFHYLSSQKSKRLNFGLISTKLSKWNAAFRKCTTILSEVWITKNQKKSRKIKKSRKNQKVKKKSKKSWKNQKKSRKIKKSRKNQKIKKNQKFMKKSKNHVCNQKFKNVKKNHVRIFWVK